MRYQNTTNGKVKTLKELKSDYPNISFPRNTDIILSVWKRIETTSKPSYDPATEKVIEIAPEKALQRWRVVPLSQAELDTLAEQNETTAWVVYKTAKEAAERQAWIDAGKPTYGEG